MLLNYCHPTDGLSKLWSSGAVWLVNLVVVAVLLVHVFVYGEPVVRRRSQAADDFWRHCKQADQDLSKVRLQGDGEGGHYVILYTTSTAMPSVDAVFLLIWS